MLDDQNETIKDLKKKMEMVKSELEGVSEESIQREHSLEKKLQKEMKVNQELMDQFVVMEKEMVYITEKLTQSTHDNQKIREEFDDLSKKYKERENSFKYVETEVRYLKWSIRCRLIK